MSGRVAAIDAINQNGRLTLFVGAASGGVWKSVNGGTTFESVFDRQPVQSIGAIAIDPSNPKIVWVGTGEGWLRNSVSIGDGIYKSTDGGENWTNVGLKDSEHIAKIWSIPATETMCWPARPDICGTIAIKVAFSRLQMAERVGGRSWRASILLPGAARLAPVARILPQFMRQPGTFAVRAGRFAPAVRAAGSTAPRMVASTGRS